MSQFFISQEKLARVKKLSLQLHNAALFNQKQIEDYNDISSFIDGALKSTYVENLCLGQLYNLLLELHLDEFADIFKIIFQSQSINLKYALQNLDSTIQKSESWQMKFQVLRKKLQQINDKENLDKDNFLLKEKNLVQFQTAMTNKEQQTALQIFNQEKKLNKEVNDIMEDIELGIFNKLDTVTNPVVLIRVNERISKNVLQLQRDSEQNVDKLLNHLNKTNQDSSNFEQIQENLQKILDNFAQISNPLDLLMLSSSHQLKKQEQQKFQELKQFVEENFTKGYMTLFNKIIKILQKLKNMATDSKLTQTTIQNDNFDLMDEEYQLQLKKLKEEITQINVQNLDLQDSYFKAEANNEQLRKLVRKLQRENKDFKEFLTNSNQYTDVYNQFLQEKQNKQDSEDSQDLENDEIEKNDLIQQGQFTNSLNQKNNDNKIKIKDIQKRRQSKLQRYDSNVQNKQNKKVIKRNSKKSGSQQVSQKKSRRKRSSRQQSNDDISEDTSNYSTSDMQYEGDEITDEKLKKILIKKGKIKNMKQNINDGRRNSSFVKKTDQIQKVYKNGSQEIYKGEYKKQTRIKNKGEEIDETNQNQQKSLFKKKKYQKNRIQDSQDESQEEYFDEKQNQYIKRDKKNQRNRKGKKQHLDLQNEGNTTYSYSSDEILDGSNIDEQQRSKQNKSKHNQKYKQQNKYQDQNHSRKKERKQKIRRNQNEDEEFYSVSESTYLQKSEQNNSQSELEDDYKYRQKKNKKRIKLQKNRRHRQNQNQDSYSSEYYSESDDSYKRSQKNNNRRKINQDKVQNNLLQKGKYNQIDNNKKISKKYNRQNQSQESYDSYDSQFDNESSQSKRERRKIKYRKQNQKIKNRKYEQEDNQEEESRSYEAKKEHNKKNNKKQNSYSQEGDEDSDKQSSPKNNKNSRKKRLQKLKKTQKKVKNKALQFEEQTQTFYNFQCNKCNQLQHTGESFEELMQMAKQDNMRILNQIRFKKTQRQEDDSANYKSFEQMPQIEQLNIGYRFSKCFDQFNEMGHCENIGQDQGQTCPVGLKAQHFKKIKKYIKNHKKQILGISNKFLIIENGQAHSIIYKNSFESVEEQNSKDQIQQRDTNDNLERKNVDCFQQNKNIQNEKDLDFFEIQRQNQFQDLISPQSYDTNYNLFAKRNSVQTKNNQKVNLGLLNEFKEKELVFLQSQQILMQLENILDHISKLPQEQKLTIIKRLLIEIDPKLAQSFFQILNLKKKQSQKLIKKNNIGRRKSNSIFQNNKADSNSQKKSYNDLVKVSQVGFKTFCQNSKFRQSQKNIHLDIKKPQKYEREKEPIERKIQKVIYSFSVERKNKSFLFKTQQKNKQKKYNPSKLKLQVLMKLEKFMNIHSEKLEENNFTKTKAIQLIDEFSQVHNHCYPKCNHKERFIAIMQAFLQNSAQKELLKLPKIILNDNNILNQF